MGIKKGLWGKDSEIKVGREGWMVGRMRLGKEEWRMTEGYINGDMEDKMKEIGEWIEEGLGD